MFNAENSVIGFGPICPFFFREVRSLNYQVLSVLVHYIYIYIYRCSTSPNHLVFTTHTCLMFACFRQRPLRGRVSPPPVRVYSRAAHPIQHASRLPHRLHLLRPSQAAYRLPAPLFPERLPLPVFLPTGTPLTRGGKPARRENHRDALRADIPARSAALAGP